MCDALIALTWEIFWGHSFSCEDNNFSPASQKKDLAKNISYTFRSSSFNLTIPVLALS